MACSTHIQLCKADFESSLSSLGGKHIFLLPLPVRGQSCPNNLGPGVELLIASALGDLSVTAEPDLADIAAFGRHPLQRSLAFQELLFPRHRALDGYPLYFCTQGAGQQSLRSEGERRVKSSKSPGAFSV